MSGNSAPDGTRYSGGEHRLTCPGTCCFVFWLIGCKPISSANWMRTLGVYLTGSGQGRRKGLTGLWLISTAPGPSFDPSVWLSAMARLTGAVDGGGNPLVFDIDAQ